MKNIFTLLLCFACLLLSGQNENLKLHYNFQSSDNNGTITDISGNGYNGTLKNNAYVDLMDTYSILNLGTSNGYLDMGENAGHLINSLSDFSISTYVCIDEASDLNANGNFIWTFSNSDDIIAQQNGCMFYSPKIESYKISLTDYQTESGIGLGSQMVKKTWKHLVYTQSGTTGTIYIDGIEKTSGYVGVLPQQLGITSFNYIGRSPYLGDAYLKGLISDFRIYNKVLSSSEVIDLATKMTGLNNAYVDYQNQPVKYVTNNNPLFTHKFTADPAALVYDNTFYIYSGQDTGNGSGYNMPNWLVFSSKDLKNWEEHPVPLKTSDFQWATGNFSWYFTGCRT
ncbi:LamG-like jellyroll fold domain-containing protein [Thalassobellus suaedae]|uniref:LamG-like jellyroll fold domain-containing protein n=1 Tax=Thalassobellus suaedae TaxID=3074124 RepID=A0ABY9XX99_9FLAO|nr:LamG-like jellyroll fold domain-containing protein [Flavobacteriaceae bacterium HL-DH14]